MVTIISFFIVLSILVFVHELGHYLAARAVGVKVLEFSLGFPPKAFGKKIGETEYMMGWVPIGGFVRLLGQDTTDENPEQPGNYAGKTKMQRFFILVAGPIMNLLFAWVFFSLMYMNGVNRPLYLDSPAKIVSVVENSPAAVAGLQSKDVILRVDGLNTPSWGDVNKRLESQGETIQLQVLRTGQRLRVELKGDKFNPAGLGVRPWVDPLAGAISPGSPAELAGIQTGDRFVRIGERKITEWSQVPDEIQLSDGKPVEFQILREGRLVNFQVTPKYNETAKRYLIGMGQYSTLVQFGFVESWDKGYNRAVSMTKMTLSFVGQLVSGNGSKDSLGGPIMIAQMVGKAAKNSSSELLALMAFISLQLGVFNLFPLPALDGGHILFLVIEALMGRPLKASVRAKIQQFGFSALLVLILYISIQDGFRLFGQ